MRLKQVAQIVAILMAQLWLFELKERANFKNQDASVDVSLD